MQPGKDLNRQQAPSRLCRPQHDLSDTIFHLNTSANWQLRLWLEVLAAGALEQRAHSMAATT
jgi:hypothetical protein